MKGNINVIDIRNKRKKNNSNKNSSNDNRI